MNTQLMGFGGAVWLGVLTSISPCPLATNIAAISYVSRDVGQISKVLLSSLLYILGRVVAYTVLGSLVVQSILSAPGVSVWLQRYMNLFLGPVLVLAGMVLLGLIELPQQTGAGWSSLRDRFQKMGFVGSGLLGLLFALSFCPVSAALFFGSLIPLAVAEQSPLWIPAVYGVGAGLPVLGFALLLTFGAKSLGRVFQQVSRVERWLRIGTGCVMLGVGVYLTLVHIFKIQG